MNVNINNTTNNLFNFETLINNLNLLSDNLKNIENEESSQLEGGEESNRGPLENKYFLENLDSCEISFNEQEIDPGPSGPAYQLFSDTPLDFNIGRKNHFDVNELNFEENSFTPFFKETPIIGFKGGSCSINTDELLNEFPSYRKEREKIKKINKKVKLNKKWQKTPNVSYPFKSSGVIGVPKNVEDETNKKKIKKELVCLHWNANGIVGKVDEIKNLINEFKPDVVSISETKTNETTESYIYEIAHLGYLPMVKSRVDSEGGGSAILFKDHLRAKPIELEERFNNLEVIGGEFKVGQSTLSVFSWYVRPQEPRVSEEFLKFAEG